MRYRGGVEASHYYTLLFRCSDRAACRCSKCKGKRLLWRAQRRTWRDSIIDFGWEGLRFALAKSEATYPHGQVAHNEKISLIMLFNAEKENDCNGNNNQNDASVRRLINAGTLGVRLLLSTCCAVNRQRVNDRGVCLDRLIYRSFVGDRGVSGAEVQPGRVRRSPRCL